MPEVLTVVETIVYIGGGAVLGLLLTSMWVKRQKKRRS